MDLLRRLARDPRVQRAFVALLVAVAGALGVILPDGGPDHPATVTTRAVDQNDKPVTLEAPKSVVDQTAKSPELNEDLHDESAASKSDVAASDRAASRLTPRINGPPPDASQYQAGCVTRANTVNYSYRTGVRPSLGLFHLTVAANRVGWGDINGVAIFLNRAATQASANYIIDREGHCLYTVAEVFKAWAQAAYNSATACSFEVQNTGSESTYAGTAGLAKLARVAHDCAHRWHIPIRRAKVSGGRVLVSGFIDHYHLGPAGGGHVDIHRFGRGCRLAAPGADTWPCVDLILQKMRALDAQAVPARMHSRCRRLGIVRARRRAGQPNLKRERELRASLKGYRCNGNTAVRQ